jgi:hypothetical protein
VNRPGLLGKTTLARWRDGVNKGVFTNDRPRHLGSNPNGSRNRAIFLGYVNSFEPQYSGLRALFKSLLELTRPVQVLDDERDGLQTRLREEHAPDRVEPALAALHGVRGLPHHVVHRHVEKRDECG